MQEVDLCRLVVAQRWRVTSLLRAQGSALQLLRQYRLACQELDSLRRVWSQTDLRIGEKFRAEISQRSAFVRTFELLGHCPAALLCD